MSPYSTIENYHLALLKEQEKNWLKWFDERKKFKTSVFVRFWIQRKLPFGLFTSHFSTNVCFFALNYWTQIPNFTLHWSIFPFIKSFRSTSNSTRYSSYNAVKYHSNKWFTSTITAADRTRLLNIVHNLLFEICLRLARTMQHPKNFTNWNLTPRTNRFDRTSDWDGGLVFFRMHELVPNLWILH